MEARYLSAGDTLIYKGKRYLIRSVERLKNGNIKVIAADDHFVFKPNFKVVID